MELVMATVTSAQTNSEFDTLAKLAVTDWLSG
jgi:hypothetical protein